jgi:cbb3-type cytochrome oxidase maturation protein
MSAFFIIISASLIVAISFLCAFIWSVKSNQYEDDETPAIRILFDNELKNQDNAKQTNTKNKIE